jgi:hypothetical protein
MPVDKDYHREYRKINNPVRKAEFRSRLAGIKEEAGCKDCGIKHPAVLQFHHRDVAEKRADVGSLVSSNRSWGVIQTEVDKCDVLCANCHLIRHHNEQSGYFAQKNGEK